MEFSYALIGNWAHLLSLSSMALFTTAAVQGWSGLDPDWKRDGFCVANAGTPYWTSHDLCLYVDLIFCTVLSILYVRLGRDPIMTMEANQIAVIHIFGCAGHGLAHGGFAKASRDGLLDSQQESNTLIDLRDMAPAKLAVTLVLSAVVWTLLVRAGMRNARWVTVVAMALLVMWIQRHVPHQLGFAYVQSVLSLTTTWNEMTQPAEKKGFEYALYGTLVCFPVVLMGWTESTLCSKGIKSLGGHLLYDAYIGVSVIAFYLVCWNRQKSLAQSKKVE